MRRYMKKLTGGAVALMTPLVLTGPAAASSELLDLAFDGAQSVNITALDENELKSMRGGYRGIAFGFFFTGDVNGIVGQGATDLPDGISITDQGADNVSLAVGLSSVPGASGIIQFTEVFGNNNVINNNLTLNVLIMEGGVADPASLMAAFPTGN